LIFLVLLDSLGSFFFFLLVDDFLEFGFLDFGFLLLVFKILRHFLQDLLKSKGLKWILFSSQLSFKFCLLDSEGINGNPKLISC